MKTLLSAFVLTVITAGIAVAGTFNTTCLLSGKPVDPKFTSKYNGKDVGFCCEKCKAKFDANPALYGKKVK